MIAACTQYTPRAWRHVSNHMCFCIPPSELPSACTVPRSPRPQVTRFISSPHTMRRPVLHQCPRREREIERALRLACVLRALVHGVAVKTHRGVASGVSVDMMASCGSPGRGSACSRSASALRRPSGGDPACVFRARQCLTAVSPPARSSPGLGSAPSLSPKLTRPHCAIHAHPRTSIP